MNHYKLMRVATAKIKEYLSAGVEIDDIIYPMLEEFGLSERKTRELAEIILKGGKPSGKKNVGPVK